MSDLEKAQALIADKNTSLKDLADKCKFSSYSTLRHDRTDLKKCLNQLGGEYMNLYGLGG